jgi:sensor histidine kinase YesM
VIPKVGEAALTMEIESLKPISAKNEDNCPIEMVAQVFDGYFDQSVNEWVGNWMEIRNDDYITNKMNDKTKRSFQFTINQKQYISELSTRYAMASSDTSTIAQETKLRCRFVAWDETNYEMTKIEKEVTITVVSSGQTGAATCDFSPLSLDNKITGTRKYRVGEENDGYHISTKIAGLANLADKDCEKELFMAINLDIGGGIIEQLWS